MTIFQAILLGIVQGLTEFLPVSSSGHLVLAEYVLGSVDTNLTLEIAVHLATLGAVVVYFWPRLLELLRKWWLPIGVGTLPAVVVGLGFKDVIESLFALPIVVGMALIITGTLNWLVDKKLRPINQNDPQSQQIQEITPLLGLAIGLAQAIAIIPGISRSGATIFAGITAGFNRQTAFAFSFLLSIPAILGATVLQTIDWWLQPQPIAILPTLIAMLAAFLTGLFALRLLDMLLKSARYELFAVYCWVVGGSVILVALV